MFIVTNTKTGSKQTTPAKKVKTGDQMTYIWGVVALIAAGIVLIVIGVRRRKE